MNGVKSNVSPYILPGLIKETISEFVIIKLVESETGISFETIKSQTRKVPIPMARHMLTYLIRKHTNLSLHQVGELLERDHTTSLNSVNVALQLIETSLEFKFIELKISDQITRNYAPARNEVVDKMKMTERYKVRRSKKCHLKPNLEPEPPRFVRDKGSYSNPDYWSKYDD